MKETKYKLVIKSLFYKILNHLLTNIQTGGTIKPVNNFIICDYNLTELRYSIVNKILNFNNDTGSNNQTVTKLNPINLIVIKDKSFHIQEISINNIIVNENKIELKNNDIVEFTIYKNKPQDIILFDKNIGSYIEKIFKNYEEVMPTINRYFVLLVGPAGVGKSLGRQIAIKEIEKLEKLFGNKNAINDDKFIDINIDDYVYGYYENENSSQSILIKETIELIEKINDQKFESFYNYDEQTKSLSYKINENIEIIKNLKEIFIKSSEKYMKIRNKIDKISDILMYSAVYYKYNIYFETTGSNYDYLQRIIYEFSNSYNYIPIVINPYIENNQVHGKRLFQRGFKEGRFRDIIEVMNTKKTIQENIEKLFQYILSAKNIKNSVILQFDNTKTILPSDGNFEFIHKQYFIKSNNSS